MNHKFQEFGRVIQGFSTIQTFKRLEVSNNTPASRIFIEDCGMASAMQPSIQSVNTNNNFYPSPYLFLLYLN
jgi:hypothetical protein